MSEQNVLWKSLLPTAMVGTERKPATTDGWTGEIGDFLARAIGANDDAPTQLLRAAAVIASCSLSGAQGTIWSEALPAAAAEDIRPALAETKAIALIDHALAEGYLRLQAEICVALDRAHLRLPNALLPKALELGRRSTALRTTLTPVLGERGIWLAAQNEEWRYAYSVSVEASDEVRWNEGSIEQRRALLRKERIEDPLAARERLALALPELAARERAELVAELSENLSGADETLLDGLRADRAREVRVVALSLLLRIPGAAHPQRAAARMTGLLSHERSLLRRRWRIEAPAAADPAWPTDNIEANRPKNESLGERAWWLYQLVRQVPLMWWPMHTGMNPSELIRWASDTDWSDALGRGWRDVLMCAPSVDWCEAFLADGETAKNTANVFALLAMLPRELREQHHIRQLDKVTVTDAYPLLSQVLSSYAPSETMSIVLSNKLVDVLSEMAASNRLQDDYGLRAVLPEIVCVLHVDALERFSAIRYPAEETTSYAALKQTLSQIISTRRALSLIKPSKSP